MRKILISIQALIVLTLILGIPTVLTIRNFVPYFVVEAAIAILLLYLAALIWSFSRPCIDVLSSQCSHHRSHSLRTSAFWIDREWLLSGNRNYFLGQYRANDLVCAFSCVFGKISSEALDDSKANSCKLKNLKSSYL